MLPLSVAEMKKQTVIWFLIGLLCQKLCFVIRSFSLMPKFLTLLKRIFKKSHLLFSLDSIVLMMTCPSIVNGGSK
jgi:hypothetical protein